MYDLTELLQVIAAFAWFGGWTLAKKSWSLFFAIFFPPWGWYLVVKYFFD